MTIQTTPHRHYVSGPLRIDLQLGVVHKGAESMRFSPVDLKVLAHLIQHQGELVSRAQLFDSVWPNQQVNDDVLTRAISDIRTSLAKLDDGKYIATLPRRGYRWAVPVDQCEIFLSAPSDMPQASLAQPAPAMRALRAQMIALAISFALAAGLVAMGVMWITSYVYMPTKISLAVLPAQAASGAANPMARLLDENLAAQLRLNQRITLLSKTAVASRPANPFPYFFNEFGARWVLEAQVEDYEGSNNIELTLVDARTGIEMRSLHFEAATPAELSVQLARKLELDLLANLAL